MRDSLALLVDTHVLAWIGEHNSRLSTALWERLEVDDLYVSAVVAYEYTDLLARNRFATTANIERLQALLDFEVLGFPAGLWRVAADLPNIHRDPVDRMLVAHAISLGMTIATADTNIHRYPVACVT